jgi:hypothetical protein
MMALGPSNFEYFWRLYLVVALLAILWTLYLVYFCERFTVYMISLVVAFLGAFCLPVCSVAYLAAGSTWGKEGLLPLLLGCAPVGITLLTYYALARGRSSFHPFEYDGLKVQPRYENRQRSVASYNPVLVAGATTLAASITINSLGHLTAAMVAMFGLQASASPRCFTLATSSEGYARSAFKNNQCLRPTRSCKLTKSAKRGGVGI